ncbi:hypothetical protein HanIR_Chr09g0400711 [Helianthus annuus]|nr:hypothetical protein HanIR_Chr09g0400711 [Helianthus annuus]
MNQYRTTAGTGRSMAMNRGSLRQSNRRQLRLRLHSSGGTLSVPSSVVHLAAAAVAFELVAPLIQSPHTHTDDLSLLRVGCSTT